MNDICSAVFVGDALGFRKVHEPPGFDESKNVDFCVGNAFMHSASATFLSGDVEWKNVGKTGTRYRPTNHGCLSTFRNA